LQKARLAVVMMVKQKTKMMDILTGIASSPKRRRYPVVNSECDFLSGLCDRRRTSWKYIVLLMK